MVTEVLKHVAGKVTQIRVKKIHLDYIAGMLSIPVLLTAVIINWGNLTHKPAAPAPSALPSPQVIVVSQGSNSPSTAHVVAQDCIKNVGPITISSPREGETITDNPVCISIESASSGYCPVVWSYRINNGNWSDFSNSSPCLYNLPNGSVKIDIRVNSTTSSDEKTLFRSFVYNGSSVVATPTMTPTPTPTTVPTSSPTPTPTTTPVASSSAN